MQVHSKAHATTSCWHLVSFDLDENCFFYSRLNSMPGLGVFRGFDQPGSTRTFLLEMKSKIVFEHRFRKKMKNGSGQCKSQVNRI
jgi:hypothetical protein